MVEVEVIGLGEVEELPFGLGCEDRGRAASEAPIVDTGNVWVMVGEFFTNRGGRDVSKALPSGGREAGFDGLESSTKQQFETHDWFVYRENTTTTTWF